MATKIESIFTSFLASAHCGYYTCKKRKHVYIHMKYLSMIMFKNLTKNFSAVLKCHILLNFCCCAFNISHEKVHIYGRKIEWWESWNVSFWQCMHYAQNKPVVITGFQRTFHFLRIMNQLVPNQIHFCKENRNSLQSIFGFCMSWAKSKLSKVF